MAHDDAVTANIKFERVQESHLELLRQFVSTELDLSITFFELAITARLVNHLDGTGAAFYRNLENGQKAYESAKRAMSRAQTDIEDEPGIANRMGKAESLLKKVEGLRTE
jgi:hypothetical protein